LLRLLAEKSAFALSVVDRELELRGLAGAVDEVEESQAICQILERVAGEHGFENALLYEADFENRRLDANYHLKANKARFTTADPEPLRYSMDVVAELSFAGHVYAAGKPLWEPEARKSELTNKCGVKSHKIKGPILGLPVIDQGVTVGVLVIWGGNVPKLSTTPHAFESVTELLAGRLSRVSVSKSVMRRLTEIVRGSQGYIGPEEAITDLLRTVRSCGFDRARFLRYAPEHNQFIREQEVSAEPSIDTRLVPIEIKPKTPAAYVVQHFRTVPQAHIFSPARGEFDPDCEILGKSPGTPWVSGFISLQGKLMGQICADNETSKRPLPSIAVALLSLAASIAALVLERVSSGNEKYLDVFPTAMFRKDMESRFQWVNDIFVRDAACSGMHGPAVLRDGGEEICKRIKDATDTDQPARRDDLDALRRRIIGENDLAVFGDDELPRSYMERDKKVLGWCVAKQCFISEKVGPREWHHERNSVGDRIRLVHVVKAPIYDELGAPVGVQGFYMQDTLARHFTGSNVGIFQSTEEGRYIYVNDAMAELLGYKSNRDPAIYKLDISEKVYDSKWDRQTFLEAIHANTSISNFEFYMKQPGRVAAPGRGETSKAVIKVAEYTWIVRDEETGKEYYEGVVRNLNQQIADSASLAMKEEDELVQLLARIIAHEVAAPMQVVRAEAHELSKLSSVLEEGEGNLRRLADSAERATNVFEAYRLNQRNMMEPTNLDKTIWQTMESFALNLQNYGFVRFDFGGLQTHNALVALPKVKIMQVVANLVSNSLRMAKENNIQHARTIMIRTNLEDIDQRGQPSHATLTYEDTAGGMDEAKASGLFRRGIQMGNGTGMLVVAKIMDRYKCRPPYVKSALGTGTLFSFAFPLYEPKQTKL
jgi:signal transduction histidine kinase